VSAFVFVVVGAKGGVGATRLAVHLAGAMRSVATYVIDADLAGRRTHATWYDIARELDVTRVPGAPATARTEQVNVVELARSYEDAFVITAEAVEDFCAGVPDGALLIVDAPQPFAAAVRPFMINAAKIIVISEPTLLGVGAAHSMLSALERFGIPANRIAFVSSDLRSAAEVQPREIADSLKYQIACELPAPHERTWAKAAAGLVELLSATPQMPGMALRPSTAQPIGGRRQARPAAAPVAASAADNLKAELHAALLTKIDFLAAARAHSDAEKLAELRQQINAIADDFLASRTDITSAEHASRVRREVVEEALGLGPLETLLADPEVTEIMVNGAANVYVERRGKIERTSKQFIDDRQVRLVIERVIAPLGRRIDESSPMVDARLPDGSRVNAIIAPLAVDGPSLTIRRFSKRFGVKQLLEVGSITQPIADFLRAAVESRLNVLVSGGTGSGKTTLLNALSGFIPDSERIVTIEDAAELQLEQPHVVRLESRPANLEGKGAIPIRELVRNSLRMRPDRIIVGECRGGEALDMLQAMNTGHDGSLTTVHANSVRDALSRVETMVLMSGFDLPVRAIREQVAAAIDLIVHVARLRDGSRRVTAVSEVVGMEGDVVTMQDIIRYHQRGVDSRDKVLGEFEPCGVQPNCLVRFEEMGVAYDSAAFSMSAAQRAEAAWLR
jgi:pilus assembly protein CpaF